MGFVKDNKGLRIEARGKPIHEDGDHIRLGVAGGKPRAALHFTESQKPHHVVAFVHYESVQFHHRFHARVGNLPEYITLFPHGVAHERTNCCTFIGLIGKERHPNGAESAAAAIAAQAVFYSLGYGGASGNGYRLLS